MRPEFINRIDEIIMFEPLTRKDILGILNLQLDALKKKMEEHGIRIDFSQKFIDYMSEKGYDPAYGARPIKRILQRELVNNRRVDFEGEAGAGRCLRRSDSHHFEVVRSENV